MIQNATVLAELPRSLLGNDGKTFVTDVYAVARNKKRKRSELAIAIDGESVNLYDVGHKFAEMHIVKD